MNQLSVHYNGPAGQEDMPYLLSFDNIITHRDVRLAMLADWGNEDPGFGHWLDNVHHRLRSLAGGEHECVFLPGPAILGLEAVISSFAAPSRNSGNLILSNCENYSPLSEILRRSGFQAVPAHGHDALTPFNARNMRDILSENRRIQAVILTHFNPRTGLVNPVEELAQVAKEFDKTVIVDASASFGALAIDLVNSGIDVMLATAEACLEGVPGVSFAFCTDKILETTKNKPYSTVMDVVENWRSFNVTGRPAFPLPGHSIQALAEALRLLHEEGGMPQRLARYQRHRDILLKGMQNLGFEPLIAPERTAPMTQAFHYPADSYFDLDELFAHLLDKGFVIPRNIDGDNSSFRIATIGALNENVFRDLLEAISEALKQMGVQSGSPGQDKLGSGPIN